MPATIDFVPDAQETPAAPSNAPAIDFQPDPKPAGKPFTEWDRMLMGEGAQPRRGRVGIEEGLEAAASQGPFSAAGAFAPENLGSGLGIGDLKFSGAQPVPAPTGGFERDLKLELPPKEGKAAQIAGGVSEGLLQLTDAMLSPIGVATLGMGGLKPGLQRAISAYFASQMASQVPDIAKQIGEEMGKPQDQRDWGRISKLLTDAGGSTIMAGFAGAHAGAPGPDFLSRFQARGPVAPTPDIPGSALITPMGAFPPRGEPAPGLELATPEQRAAAERESDLAAGKGPEPAPRLPKATVPEGPSDPRVQKAKDAGADSINKVLAMFPEMQGNREAARIIRDQAFPEQATERKADATRTVSQPEHIGATPGADVQAQPPEVRPEQSQPDSDSSSVQRGTEGQTQVPPQVSHAAPAPKPGSLEHVSGMSSGDFFDLSQSWQQEAMGALKEGKKPLTVQERAEQAARDNPNLEAWKAAKAKADAESKAVSERIKTGEATIKEKVKAGELTEAEGKEQTQKLYMDGQKDMFGAGQKSQFFSEGLKILEGKETAKTPPPAETPKPTTPPAEVKPSAEPPPSTPKAVETTPVTSTTPAPAAKTVEAAETKAQTEVTKAAQAGGERSAKDIKSELVDRIQKQIEKAPNAWDTGTKTKIKISIPGDGDFTVLNTKEALTEMLSRAKSLSTSEGKGRPSPVPVEREKAVSDTEVNKVIQAYGSPEAAYRSLKNQLTQLEAQEPRNAEDAAQRRNQIDLANAVMERLYNKTKAGDLAAKAEVLRDRAKLYREGGKGFDTEIAKLEAMKRPTQAHKAKLVDLAARRSENRLRVEQMEMEARKLDQSAKEAKEALEQEPPKKPGDGGRLYLNPIGQILKPILEPLNRLRQVIAQRLNERPVRHQVDQYFDASDNMANIAGQRAGKSIATGISREADLAGSAAIAAGFDPRRLPGMLAAVAGKNADAEAGIRYAMTHWPQAEVVGRRGQAAFDAQLAAEHAAKIDTLSVEDYLPGVYDTDLWMGHGRPFTLGRSSGGTATGFRKGKTYATPFEAVADGYEPRTLRLSELVEHRVRQGQRLINRRAFVDGLRTVNAVSDNKPIVTDMETRSRGPGLPDYQVAPMGYVPRQILPGSPAVAVHEDFAKLIDALNGNSKISEFEPGGVPVGDVALAVAGGVKHGLLVFDTFHASRIMQKQMFLKAGLPSWKRGQSLLEYNTADLNRAVAAGEITPEIANWVRANKPKADLLIKNGYNVGRVQEQMYSSVVRGLQQKLAEGARALGVPRQVANLLEFNKWVFEKMTRGAMMEGGLIEFDRAKAANPNLSDDQIALKVARDLNAYFGNLGRQGVFKSQTFLDASRLAFLAPQWVESMARSEILGAAQLARVPYDSVRAKRLMVGTLGTGLARGLLAYAVGSQILNLITRKHFTWDNPEKDHKWDAWIPDVTGKTGGYFLSPLSVPAELTHDMIRYMHQGENLLQAANHIRSNRSSPLWRAGSIIATGRDWNDQKIVGAWDRVKQAAWAVAPTPIPLQPVVKGGQPGQVQRQLMASTGLKTEAVGNAEKQALDLAHNWMRNSTDAKTLHKYETQQKQEFGESDYKPLRKALEGGDLEGSMKAYQKLLDEGKKPKQIFQTMRPFTVHEVGDQTFRRNKPFAGMDQKEEQRFIKSLSPEERGVIVKMQKGRQENFNRFKDMLQKFNARKRGEEIAEPVA